MIYAALSHSLGSFKFRLLQYLCFKRFVNLVLLFCIAIIIGNIPAFAQITAQENTEQKKVENESESVKDKKTKKFRIKEIVVKGQLFKEKESPYTVNIIDSDKIKDMNISQAADIFKEVPGIKMAEYNQGGVSNAVAVRGFSGGVHGDDLGLYLDGIPLNEVMGHGGGYADPNIIIPVEIEKVLVYKGPTTALYGNFSKAGTMAFFTRKKGDYDIISAKYGSNNTSDTQAAVGVKIDDNFWNNTALQFFRSDGYTQNSEQIMGNASTRFTFDATQNLQLSLSLRAHGAEWNAPGYITKDQFENGQAFKQTPGAHNHGGDRTQFCERLDIGYRASNNLKINFWGFGSETDWTRFSAPTLTTQREQGYEVYKAGGGTNINYSNPLVNLTGGLEYYTDGTEYREWNTNNRIRTSDKTQFYKDRLDNYVMFAESEIKLHPLFRPTIGARVDAFTGDYKNRLTGEHDKFGLSQYYHLSPKAGFRSTVIDEVLDFRGSACNGYVMPKNVTIFVGDDIKPSNMWQYEIGTTITKNDLIWFDAAGYILDTYNEIQADPADTGNYYKYTNTGYTRRIGAETAAIIKPVKKFELNSSFSWISTDIRSHRNSSLEGKSLTGIPQYTAKAGLKAELPSGPGLKAEWVYVGKSYILADNTDTYNGYNLFNAGIYYRIIKNANIDIAFDVKNIFNTHYAPYAGSPTGFSTGAPRTFWGSLNMRW